MNLNSGLFGAGIGIPNVNVHIQARNVKTGEITYDIEKHNRVMKSSLYTLARVINGEFCTADNDTINNNKRFQLYNYVPRYMALGSNVAPASGRSNTNVSSEVTINDNCLLNELNYPRMKLTQKNLIEDRYSAPYIKLTIKHYVPVTAFVGEEIAEAGLFCEQTGNNLWAIITINKNKKDDVTVVDITWEITIISLESTDDPYVDVDKSALWQSFETTFGILENKYGQPITGGTGTDLSTLMKLLEEAIKIYASQYANQTTVGEITQKLSLEADKVKNL